MGEKKPSCYIIDVVSVDTDTFIYRSQHPRLKGGLFLMLNYFFTNLVLGVALGFSILRHVPNIFQGVKLPPLAADIRVSIVYKLNALTRCNV